MLNVLPKAILPYFPCATGLSWGLSTIKDNSENDNSFYCEMALDGDPPIAFQAECDVQTPSGHCLFL